MLNINIGSRQKPDRSGNDLFLIINNEESIDSWAFKSHNKRLHAGIYDETHLDIINTASFDSLMEKFESIRIPYENPKIEELTSFKIEFEPSEEDTHYLKFDFNIDTEEWDNPWSIKAWAKKITDIVDKKKISGLSCFRDDDDFIMNGFGFRCTISNPNKKVIEEIAYWEPIIEEIINEAILILATDSTKNTLTTLFRFPQKISTACEQYLMYFGQFLADLGIDATVNLNHGANQVLFSVIPSDPSAALESIRSALDMYLQLPIDQSARTEMSKSSDIAVLQLRANLSHLEGQLNLAHAVLQAKNATIQAQDLQLSHYRLPTLQSGQEILNDANKKDSETVIEGLISVRDTEIKGVVLHIPELIRRLKRKFS